MSLGLDRWAQDIIFVGDTHGNLHWWKKLFEDHDAKVCPNQVYLQVGDFGYWEHTDEGVYYLDWLQERLEVFDSQLIFLRGNHENQKMLKNYAPNGKFHGHDIIPIRKRILWAQDGSSVSLGAHDHEPLTIGFYGGARSVDAKWRKPGISWWEDEVATDETLEFAKDSLQGIDILLTHDGSDHVSLSYLCGGEGFPLTPRLEEMCRLDRVRIANLINEIEPKVHIHGHFHNAKSTRCTEPPRHWIIGLGKDGDRSGASLSLCDIARFL